MARIALSLFGVGKLDARKCLLACVTANVVPDALLAIDRQMVVAKVADRVALYIRIGRTVEWTRMPELWSKRLRSTAQKVISDWTASGLGRPAVFEIRQPPAS